MSMSHSGNSFSVMHKVIASIIVKRSENRPTTGPHEKDDLMRDMMFGTGWSMTKSYTFSVLSATCLQL